MIRLSSIPTPANAAITSQAISSNEIFVNTTPPVSKLRVFEKVKHWLSRKPRVRSLSAHKPSTTGTATARASKSPVFKKKMRSATPIKAAASSSLFSSSAFHPSGNNHLAGADFYHGNSQAEFNAALPKLSWVALKAGQGTSYTDEAFKSRWAQVGNLQQQGKMPLRIAYEYLDPGNGAAQASHLLSTVGINGKLPAGTRLALDFEGAALKSPQTLKDAAQAIYNKTGQWPIVYASTSVLPTVKKYVPQAPIWEANYNQKLDDSPFDQYTDKPFDQDLFNGTLTQLKAFAGY